MSVCVCSGEKSKIAAPDEPWPLVHSEIAKMFQMYRMNELRECTKKARFTEICSDCKAKLYFRETIGD